VERGDNGVEGEQEGIFPEMRKTLFLYLRFYQLGGQSFRVIEK
jgi:hypothetical protein